MGVLKDKILSYSPEQYFTNEAAYTSTSLTNYGSLTNTVAWTNTGGSPTLNSTGGPDGSGCWQFSTNSASEQALRSFGSNAAASAAYSVLVDNDYSVGGWFRIPAQANGNTETALDIIRLGGSTTGTLVQMSLTGTNIGKLQLQNPSLTTSIRYDDGEWHYYAERYYFNGTNSIKERYIDGSLVSSGILETTNTLWYLTMGDNSILNAIASPTFTEIAHLYAAPSSSIDATAISEIWTTGSAGGAADITITETPATASALQTEPTIAVTAGDHTEVTTSIPVSADMGSATVSVEAFLNLTVGPATAYSEMTNNVIVSSSNSVDFGAQEFTASAELIEPFLAETSMTATAESGNHSVYVDPNYFNAVKQLNPYLYINNGAGAGSIVNHGYQAGTFTRGSDLLTLQDGGTPLNLVREGDSWLGKSTFSNDSFIDFTTSTTSNSFANLLSTANYSYEAWVKPLELPTNSPTGSTAGDLKTTFVYSDPVNSSNQVFAIGTANLATVSSNGYSFPRHIYVMVPGMAIQRVDLDSTPIALNKWSHIVLSVFQSGIDPNKRQLQLWIDGQICINIYQTFTPFVSSTATARLFGSEGTSLERLAYSYFDEIAIYDQPLSNSQIINHFELISTLSPDSDNTAEAFAVDAESGDHQFAVTSNAVPEIKEATASALAVTPTLIAGVSYTDFAEAMTSSATMTDPGLSTGNTITATPITAYAESVNAFALNSVYYDYVQANIAPYRYVTFDAANVYADYGTDNDYSVQPTVVGGTIVNPDEGISGKSAKTAGVNYVTDGVILKESEWDDNWGTGQSTYHSSFWMQKAEDDVSTGLRVLWNLNGYLDNQHVILFQYQGKLHMQFNNGSGTHLDAVTANNIDLFDGQRHFVVVAFDHTNNNNNTVHLYVDSVLVLTASLGSYNGTTVNGTSYVGPNDEANNHPRLGVGCLITPFAETALPVVPTNTRIIVDEILWAKTAINQAGVTALFNIMPDKNNSDNMADPMTASALIVNAAISTTAVYVATAATASALATDETITADRNIVVAAESATATVEMPEPLRVDNVVITSDIMVATAIFNDAGVRITLSGGPMLANVQLVNRFGSDAGFGIKVNNKNINYVLSPWAAWLRSTQVDNILAMREVK